MRISLTSILLIISLSIFSQSDFERLDSHDGLSQNDINFILQDSKGFMWFGTVDGLNRYDGLQFVHYKITTPMEYPIGSNLPFCMVEDKKGNFWIGTSDNGIWFLNREKEQFKQYPTEKNGERLLLGNNVSSLFLDPNGMLWSTSDEGLSIIDTEKYYKGEWVSYLYEGVYNSDNDLNRWLYGVGFVDLDAKGRFWIGSKEGVFEVTNADPTNLSLNKISEIWGGDLESIIDVDGGLLFSIYSGVYYLNDKMETTKVSDYFFNKFIKTSKGEIFGGNKNGLYKFSWDVKYKKLIEQKHYFYDFNNVKSLSTNNVFDIYEDRSGLLWVGTNGGGLNKLDLNEKKFNHFYKSSEKGSLSYNKIRALHEDNSGNLWVGTEGGGISFLPRKKESLYDTGFKYFDVSLIDFGQNYVYCFEDIPDTENKVLLGAGYPMKLGLATVSKSGEVKLEPLSELITNPAFTIFKDSHNILWIGTYGGGLYRAGFNTDAQKLEIYQHYMSSGKPGKGLTSNRIRSIIEDAKGNILIGTDKGLNILPYSERHRKKPAIDWIHYDYNNPKSLAHNYILAMCLDREGRVWIGTMGGGLCLLQRDDKEDIYFKRYTSKQGLPNDVIKAIEEDETGNLWISTNNGLTRFNPESEEMRNYSIADGLQDNEFSELASCKRFNGEFLFGGVNGVNNFVPEEIVDNPYASDIEFTNLSILNDPILPGKARNGHVVLEKEMASTDSLQLRFSEGSFSVGFTALHFVAPEKIKYKYMLEGFDTDWNAIQSMEPVAKYTNIPPGEYVLKVLATNNDGVWNSVPATLFIEVVPPFWRTTWAMLIYGFVLIAMLMFFRRYSIIAITQKNDLMMEHFKKEQMEELVQLKLQFFTNISHEFRTPLTLIQTPLEKLMDGQKVVDEQTRQNSYSLMMKNISILNRLINQLMEFRKLEKGRMPLEVTKGNLYDLVKEVVDAFREIAQAKNIQFELKSMYSIVELWFDYDKIEKVLFNLLSNAFKFTRAEGMVSVELSEEEMDGSEWVRIDVIDNGPGIDKEKLPFLFNRFYQTGSHKLSKVSGTGIGLSYAKNLVLLHKGLLKVTSEPNVKTKFSVFLKKGKMHFDKKDFSDQTVEDQKRSIALTKEIHLANQIEKTEEKIQLSQHKSTVLIVEDNHDVQELLKETLQEEFNCIQAYNGVEGLELALKYSPNIIVSDVMMPEMDGFEMCSKIKNDEMICHIPVLMLTAKSTDSDRVTGFGGGAEAYVAKPFKMEVLIAQIKSILDSRKKVIQKFSKSLSVEPKDVTFTSIDEKLIERLLKVVEANISNPEFTVVQLAEEVGMSQSILNKKLKALMGQTANVFIRTIRLKRAAQLLKLNRHSVTDIVYEVGFNDVKYFRECFRKQFNLTPSEYAKENAE
ncbi:hybrid sensor histidine kinase/response regulator transcription factor [Saccharicrinis fermentans]|uniref:histidine kinase n=1 Tax=Saccharicrinis fermentans DSM 9555 = JCM 21142 TaxID=869213 RepID=W7YK91_9BACT|nr:two-component regulator propeller domain-containing protein [Saccharicrinis fermentans]GAF02764.1 sensor protein EvgS precursor [Saccharicrinis fermentans DSM 9555 = JCM 21142]